MITPSGRKVTEAEEEEEEEEREKNAVNSGHLVPCSARKPLGPIYLLDKTKYLYSNTKQYIRIKLHTSRLVNVFKLLKLMEYYSAFFTYK